ncbi:hypothetical protein [Halarsenatibacter silvermanii]|uniref:Uncharacterized protein n=1 Tax=Halarsenatibacter silvermanii TaxID=321763 RepID=A0A1G9KUA0_9FIRM|nr:hypothetical protein [Halarsenatibacter silvermanii]SDL53460.1 hypothetical protein SAMN04488692_105109 [Halarsenatibacter silvermanii]
MRKIFDDIFSAGSRLKPAAVLLLILALLLVVPAGSARGLDFAEIDDMDDIELDELIDEILHIRRISSEVSRLSAFDELAEEIYELKENDDNNDLPARYRGDDDQVTDIYELESPWEVRWESRGRIFRLYVYDEEGDRIDAAANTSRGGEGIYTGNESGKYYLEIRATGDWRLEIKDEVYDDFDDW